MAGTAATAQQKPPAQQQQRGNTVLGRVAICIVVCQILLVVLASLVFSPPVSFLGTRLSLLAPFVHQVDLTQLHQVYHERYEEVFAAGGQKDLLFDWTQPVPHWLYHLVERFAQWIEIDLPASILPAPLHLMHVMQGPARMQVMRAVVLLGVPDLLADRVLSLSDLYDSVRANAAGQAQTMREGLLLKEGEPLPGLEHMPIGKLERLMHYALTFGYFSEVGYVGSHIYTNNAQSAVLRKDHPNSQCKERVHTL
jgi:hypothetical protein